MAVLLCGTRSCGLCLICAQGSVKKNGPENQGESSWQLQIPLFFPKDICGCSQELLPARLCWRDRLWQGEEQWPRGRAAVPVAGSPWSWQALACTAPFRAGSGQLPAGIRGLWEKWRAAVVCAGPASSSQPTGSRVGWHG